jgi:hypothetical protein
LLRCSLSRIASRRRSGAREASGLDSTRAA